MRWRVDALSLDGRVVIATQIAESFGWLFARRFAEHGKAPELRNAPFKEVRFLSSNTSSSQWDPDPCRISGPRKASDNNARAFYSPTHVAVSTTVVPMHGAPAILPPQWRDALYSFWETSIENPARKEGTS